MKFKKDLEEYRQLSKEEVSKKIFETSEELMKTRFNKSSGQLVNTNEIKNLKKSLARMKTVLVQKAAASVN